MNTKMDVIDIEAEREASACRRLPNNRPTSRLVDDERVLTIRLGLNRLLKAGPSGIATALGISLPAAEQLYYTQVESLNRRLIRLSERK